MLVDQDQSGSWPNQYERLWGIERTSAHFTVRATVTIKATFKKSHRKTKANEALYFSVTTHISASYFGVPDDVYTLRYLIRSAQWIAH